MYTIIDKDRKKLDNEYWENYYLAKNIDFEPSLFAQYVFENYLKKGETLIDLGCGIGRDSCWFAENGINVLAVDQCRNVEKHISKKAGYGLAYKCGDFTRLGDVGIFNYAYSRFTLHAITETDENKVIKWAAAHLYPKGKFLIEVRSLNNDLYKKGEPVECEPNAFIYNDHYRRFLDKELFCKKLKKAGFDILLVDEAKDFAPHNNTNEIFMRVIAQLRAV